MRPGHRSRPRGGFTLVELLVVITIIGIVSVATIPVIMPALANRRVSEAARILQGALVGARDAAIHNGEPRGIRFLPDPALTLPALNATDANGNPIQPGTLMLSFNRYVPIEPAPDYTEGRISIHDDWGDPFNSGPNPITGINYNPPIGHLVVFEAVYDATNPAQPQFNSPTQWAWNIRVGDTLQFKNAGRNYTVVGPVVVANPDGFINYGAPDAIPPAISTMFAGNQVTLNPEFLYLVNGVDDDGDGFVDDGFDGIDNDLDGVPDSPQTYPTGSPISGECEREVWLGDQRRNAGAYHNSQYVINRRPTVSQGARETFLPGGVVIDATTWNGHRERSRFPLPALGGTTVQVVTTPSGGTGNATASTVLGTSIFLDIMVNENGQVFPNTPYSGPGAFTLDSAFFHLWLTDRQDVHSASDLWGATAAGVPNPNPNASTGQVYQLPMPKGTAGYPPSPAPAGFVPIYLTGERRLVTLFTRTGAIVTNEIENFTAADVSQPFYEAQLGVREAK